MDFAAKPFGLFSDSFLCTLPLLALPVSLVSVDNHSRIAAFVLGKFWEMAVNDAVMKKTQTLGFKLGVIILIFSLAVLGCCGVLTYFNQMSSYHQQCETNLRNVGEFLEDLIVTDSEDFVRYQTYFLEHYKEAEHTVGTQGSACWRGEGIDAESVLPFPLFSEHLDHFRREYDLAVGVFCLTGCQRSA